MATDNSQILNNNQVGRSYFDISRKTHTSQKLGTVAVSDVMFCLPKDTIKHSKGQTYELKPTTNRIVSKIYGNSRSVAVPIRQVWKYFDAFLAKDKHFIEGGAFNTTYMMRKESETASYLPYMNPARLIGCFLACFTDGDNDNPNNYLWSCNGNAPDPGDDERLNGNVQSYVFSSLTDTGTLKQRNTAIIGPWWLPRVCGDGFFSSGVNYTERADLNGDLFAQFTFTAPEVVNVAKLLYELMKANQSGCTFALQTHEINSFFVTAQYVHVDKMVHFGCGFGKQSYGDVTLGSAPYKQALFSVSTYTKAN